jgi:hypothetical protein
MFVDYTLDMQLRELHRRGHLIKLRAKVFELLAQLWPHHHVSNAALSGGWFFLYPGLQLTSWQALRP